MTKNKKNQKRPALSIHNNILPAFLNAKAPKIERYNTIRYNINEGLLQSTIGNIEVDKNNFCWISLPEGIHKIYQ